MASFFITFSSLTSESSFSRCASFLRMSSAGLGFAIMKSLSRPALLLLFPIVLSISCNRAGGDRPPPDGLSTPIEQKPPSLDKPPVVILGFIHPAGTVVTTTAHQPL